MLIEGIGPQSALWPHGISGDRPIVLVRIEDIEHIELVHDVLRAFEYWKTKRLAVDVVILNDRMSSYAQDLQVSIEALVRKSITPKPERTAAGMGDIYTLRADLLPPESMRILPAVARAVLIARRGDLASQMNRLADAPAPFLRPEIPAKPVQLMAAPKSEHPDDLQFFNGLGGFSADGREYVTHLGPDNTC